MTTVVALGVPRGGPGLAGFVGRLLGAACGLLAVWLLRTLFRRLFVRRVRAVTRGARSAAKNAVGRAT